MRRLSKAALSLVAAVAVATFAGSASPALAQCSTCPTPTVAFSPVVQPVTVAPVVVAQPARTGWYPGRMFDQWRMNRWSAHNPTLVAPATVQTVGFAPTVQTVGFAPTVQTVNFAPAAPVVQTVNFAPSASYVTAYAPMQRTVVGFAPTATTVFSPAVIEPVVSGCSTCATASPCSSCGGATTVVEQATFTSPVSTVAPASGCSSCAETSAPATYVPQATPVPQYAPAPQAAAPPTSASQPIPQPQLAPHEAAPAGQGYGANRPETPTNGATQPAPAEKSVIDPTPAPDADATTDGTSTSFEFKAPQLLNPQNDRTANRPTVDIHDAVYRQPARKANVNTTTVAKPVTPVSTAPQAAASGWTTVSER